MIKCLVLSGGGFRGLSYLGVINFLENNNLLCNITGFYGTSVGAIVCALISIGYGYTELKYCINKLNIESLIDLKEINLELLFDKWGLLEPNKLYLLLKLLIDKKTNIPNITFRKHYEIYNNTLVIVGSNITKMKAEYFSYINTPDMTILDAIKISTCLPIIFKPITIDNNQYLDGGIYDNYPFQYAKLNYKKNEILGIHLNFSFENLENKPLEPITNFENFIKTVIFCLVNNFNDTQYIRHDKYTVKIVHDSFSIITINIENIDEMIDLGFKAMENYYNENINRFTDYKINLHTIDYNDNTSNITSYNYNDLCKI